MKKLSIGAIAVILALDLAFIAGLHINETSKDFSQEYVAGSDAAGPFDDVEQYISPDVIAAVIAEDDTRPGANVSRIGADPERSPSFRFANYSRPSAANERRPSKRQMFKSAPALKDTVITYRTFDAVKLSSPPTLHLSTPPKTNRISRSEGTASSVRKKNGNPVLKAVKKPYDWLKGVASLFD